MQKSEFGNTGRFPIIDQSQSSIAGWTNDETVLVSPNGPLVIFGDHTCIVKLVDAPFAQGADGIKILETTAILDPRFLYHLLRVRPLVNEGYNRHFTKLKAYEIPVPPLEVQREIVAEIEGYQKVIDGARAVVENYRPRIDVDPAWPMVTLETVCKNILSGGTPLTKREEYWTGNIPWITSADICDIRTATPRRYITEEAILDSATNLIPAGNVIVVTRVGLGKLFTNAFDVCISQDSQGLILKDEINAKFLAFVLQPKVDEFKKVSRGSTIQGVTKSQLAEIRIPLPPLEVQQEIAAAIADEQHVIDANQELIQRFEGKIEAVIGRVWGK